MKMLSNNLFELLERPIEAVWATMHETVNDDETSGAIKTLHSVPNQVFAITMGGTHKLTHLLIGCCDGYLCIRESTTLDGAISLLKELDPETNLVNDTSIALCDLSSYVSPVPDWPFLQVTKAVVIRRASNSVGKDILGVVLWMNLDVRIGVFVAPNPGVSIGFNESCDEILNQATQPENQDTILLETKEYLDRRTPKTMSTLDWFEWVRRDWG